LWWRARLNQEERQQKKRQAWQKKDVIAAFLHRSDVTMPKRTWQPKRIPRRRKHGFLSRMSTKTGRNVINRRRQKGRWALSVSNERRAVRRGHR
jgi:large subunit ribosomal protein L34